MTDLCARSSPRLCISLLWGLFFLIKCQHACILYLTFELTYTIYKIQVSKLREYRLDPLSAMKYAYLLF